jgi:hypothetical protein
MNKPREFWIEKKHLELLEMFEPNPYLEKTYLHVREVMSKDKDYKALYESTLKQRIRLAQKICVLEDKLEIAIEALKFECNNRCANENPCNAKETLEKINEKL